MKIIDIQGLGVASRISKAALWEMLSIDRYMVKPDEVDPMHAASAHKRSSQCLKLKQCVTLLIGAAKSNVVLAC